MNENITVFFILIIDFIYWLKDEAIFAFSQTLKGTKVVPYAS